LYINILVIKENHSHSWDSSRWCKN